MCLDCAPHGSASSQKQSNCNRKRVVKVVLAVCALHNYLMSRNSCYATPNDFNYEENGGHTCRRRSCCHYIHPQTLADRPQTLKAHAIVFRTISSVPATLTGNTQQWPRGIIEILLMSSGEATTYDLYLYYIFS